MPGNPLCARETRGINHPSHSFIEIRHAVHRRFDHQWLERRERSSRPHIYDAFMFAIASMNLL
jgi:hypothetical protein